MKTEILVKVFFGMMIFIIIAYHTAKYATRNHEAFKDTDENNQHN
jgi:hypothetical protein